MRKALDELTELGVLERDETRRIQFFHINRDHDLVEPLKALFEAESRRIVELQEAVKKMLDGGAVREHTLSIILFRSNARGDARPTSDLDLMAITGDRPQVELVLEVLIDAIPELQRRFGMRASPVVMDKASAQERYRDGDALMKNVLSDGRRLYGTPFYKIVDVSVAGPPV